MPQLRGAEEPFELAKGLTFEELKELDEIVHKDTEGFRMSQPLMRIPVDGNPEGKAITVDLKTMFVLAAISGNNMFIKGGKGLGKTSITEGILRSMFGADHASFSMNTQFGVDMLFRPDFAGMQSHDGNPAKDLATVSNPTELLTSMAVREDEHGRAPPQINAWEDWHARDIVTGPGGRQVIPGVMIRDGKIVLDNDGKPLRITDMRDSEKRKLAEGAKPYQFIVALSNSGAGYSGVFDIDPADADRYPVVIDADTLYTTEEEEDLLFNGGEYTPKPANPSTAKRAVELIISMNEKIGKLPLSEASTLWLRTLKHGDNCIRSPTGTKAGLEGFDPTSDRFCKGCNAAGQQGTCGHVSAPSPRAIFDLRRFAKAVAAYRIAVEPNSPHYVMDSDITAAGVYLLAGKRMEVSREWGLELGNGSMTYATEKALRMIHQHMGTSLSRLKPIIEAQIKGPLTPPQTTALLREYETNPSIIPGGMVPEVSNALKIRDRSKNTST